MYEGDVLCGKRHGQGRLCMKDNSILYTGDWVYGRITGKVFLFVFFCVYVLCLFLDCSFSNTIGHDKVELTMPILSVEQIVIGIILLQ